MIASDHKFINLGAIELTSFRLILLNQIASKKSSRLCYDDLKSAEICQQ